jgi:hypothetical protein
VRQSIALAAVVLLLAGGVYYFLKDEGLPPIKTTAAEPDAAEENLIFSSGSINEKQDGKDIWELNAQSIVTNVRAQKAQLSKVTGTFYGGQTGAITLAAENAVVDNATKNIELTEKVAITGQGITLNAPSAKWDGFKFLASGGIDVKKDDLVLTGETLEASPDLEKIIVKGRARLVKGVSENE